MSTLEEAQYVASHCYAAVIFRTNWKAWNEFYTSNGVINAAFPRYGLTWAEHPVSDTGKVDTTRLVFSIIYLFKWPLDFVFED